MADLYEELRNAGSDSARRAITNNVIDTMRTRPDNNEANAAYWGFCLSVIYVLGYQSMRMSSDYAGQLPPLASAALVLGSQRVSGFMNAIHAVPKADTALEAGPGASAILSIAAARRGAEVVSYEIDPRAAECAHEVIRLTGYTGQIDIKTGDVLTAADLPEHVGLAIAEILGPGLREENGPAVIAALKHRATHVIPDGATLYATDSLNDQDPWQKVADVDLTSPISRIGGVLLSTDAGRHHLRVRADIRAQGRDIVAGLGTDDLTSPVSIGGPIEIPYAGLPIEFAYDIGPIPPATPDYVRVLAND
jgi:hypothetical protein